VDRPQVYEQLTCQLLSKHALCAFADKCVPDIDAASADPMGPRYCAAQNPAALCAKIMQARHVFKKTLTVTNAYALAWSLLPNLSVNRFAGDWTNRSNDDDGT
jgi:hypothetical protein